MKKHLLPLLLLAAPAFAAQQEITAVPASPANPSIGSLKTAINLRLADIDENFDEIYPILTAGPVYVNPTAPADTKVVWVDTDQSNAIKVYVSGVWTVVGTAGEGSYTLPTAAADTLGGIKVGARLTITDGVLSADVQTGAGDDLGTAAVLDYGTDIGNVVRLIDDGEGNPALPFTLSYTDLTDKPTIPADVGDLTDTGGLLGGSVDSLDDLSDVTLGTPSSGQVLKFNGSVWAADADSTAEGAGYVSTPPTYSDEACTAGQYAFSTTTGYVCVSSGDWNTFSLTDWNNPTPDTTPAAFSFVDQTDVNTSTEITSALVQITGINAATAVTASGGTAAICTSSNVGDCGTFGTSPGNITNDQYIAARHTSSASAETAVNTVVTVGGVSDTFTSTTAAGLTAIITQDTDDGGSVPADTSTYSIGQSFSGVSEIDAIDLYAHNVGTEVTLYLCTGTDMSTTQIASATATPIGIGPLRFTFSGVTGLNPATTYYFGISKGSTTTNVRRATSNVYAGGAYQYSGTAMLIGSSITHDLRFTVYGAD